MSSRTGGADLLAAAMPETWAESSSMTTAVPFGLPPRGAAPSSQTRAEPSASTACRSDAFADRGSTYSSNSSASVRAVRLSRGGSGPSAGGTASAATDSGIAGAVPDGLPDRSSNAPACAASRAAAPPEAPAATTAYLWAGVSVTEADGEPVAGYEPGTAAPASEPSISTGVASAVSVDSASRAGIVAPGSTCSSNRTASAPSPRSRRCGPPVGAGAVVSGTTATGSPSTLAISLSASSLTAPWPTVRRIVSPPVPLGAYATTAAAFWAAVSVTTATSEAAAPGGSRAADAPASRTWGAVPEERATRDICAASTSGNTGSVNCMRSVPRFRSSSGAGEPTSSGGVPSVVTLTGTSWAPANGLPDTSSTAPAPMSSLTGGADPLAASIACMSAADRARTTAVPFGLPSRGAAPPSRARTEPSAPSMCRSDPFADRGSIYSSNVILTVRASRLSRG